MSGNTTENNQLTSVSVNNGSVAYLDQLISLRIFKLIDKMSGKMDIKSVIFLIGLVGADSLKSFIKNTIEGSITKLTGVDFYALLSRLFVKHKKYIEPLKEDKNALTLLYKPKDIFWSNLDKYSGFSYTCISNEIEQISKNEYTLYKNVYNIIIKHADFECSIAQTLKLKYICTGNEERLKCFSQEKFKFDCTKTLTEQIPFSHIINKYYNNITSMNWDYTGNHLAFIKKLENSFDAYRNKSSSSQKAVLCILSAGRSPNTVLKFSKGDTLFGIEIPEDFQLLFYSPSILNEGDKVKEWVDANVLGKADNTGTLTLNLKSENKSIDLLQSWTNFVYTLQKDSVDTSSERIIKLYDLKIIENEEIVDIPNPEYKEETEKSKETDSQKEPKTIKKVLTKRTIEENLINELYKDLSTLFLKEKDSFLLNNTLNRFKNNKNIYTHLGLPYKFGALLYGEPGTGKSSAINAIASFLQKDIYYIDLTNVKTNDDLKLLFNRVNKEKTTNGIIVIEDIDAMTDVVHIRTEESKNSALTLECFLNLLQGTLTQDGTTFLITTNHLEKLDPAFYRDGRFDIKLNLTACDHYQMNAIYSKFFNKQIPKELLLRLPEEKITPATFIQEMLPYILTPETEDTKILQNLIK